MELPLEGLLIAKIEFVKVFGLFEEIVLDKIDSILGLCSIRKERRRRLGTEALGPGCVDASLLNRHEWMIMLLRKKIVF